MPLPTGARLGVYEILGPIGAGGMGEVYRARDTRLGRAGQPRWSPDGSKVLFLSGGRILTEVAVETRPAFHSAEPKETFAVLTLLTLGSSSGMPGNLYSWVPLPDGRAIVVVIENWRAKLVQ